MKRFLLQGNYVMFDYFHTRVYPFENCESFSPISILPSSPIPPPLLNGKRAAAEIDPRPAVWIGNFEEELHKLNFFWGFQWYTWPSLKVDFDSDSIEFEDILSCTGVCVKQSPFRARSWISNSHSNWKIGLVQSEIISFSLNLPNPWF